MNINTVKNLQKELEVEVDGIIGPITRKAIADRLLGIAKGELGIHETSRNQGPGIAKYWTATNYQEGYANREPWCAAFICWVIKQSNILTDNNRPKSASAYGFEDWAKELGIKVMFYPNTINRGDIVIYQFSHIGIASSNTDRDGDFTAIEGNTNMKGDREGGSVLEKTRSISSVRSVIRF